MEHNVKITRRIQIAAWVLLGVLTAALLASACLTWAANYYYPVADGLVSPEQLPVLESRLRLTGVQDPLEAILLLAGQLGYPALLIVLLVKRCELPTRQKWLYVGAAAVAFALATVPFALLDPLFSAVHYFFTPGYLLAVLILCVALESGIRLLRQKKRK